MTNIDEHNSFFYIILCIFIRPMITQVRILFGVILVFIVIWGTEFLCTEAEKNITNLIVQNKILPLCL